MNAEPQTEFDAIEAQFTAARERYVAACIARGAMDVPDYALQRPDGTDVKLSELFGDKDQLILIHNMGFSCPYCTMWADGLNGLWRYADKRAAFVLVSNDRPDQQLAGAQMRGWTFPMATAAGTSMFVDMDFGLEKDGKTWWQPGYSTLYKDSSGNIKRHSYDVFGPGDLYNPIWHMFDQLHNNDMSIEPTEGM